MGIKIDIAAKYLKIIQVLLRQYLPHTVVWAFGSRVKFTAKPNSDLDLVAFIADEQAMKFSLLKDALQESDIPFRIDLHNWNELPPSFHKNIKSNYVVMQSDEKPVPPEGWKTYKLGDIVQIIGGGTPRTTVEEYWNGDIPWLSVVDFGKSIKTVYTTEKTITERGLRESSTKILKKGQIIISARGTVGELAMLGKDMAFNQSCYGLTATKETTNEFLYYLVKYSIGKIKQNTHGAVFDTITKKTFENIEVTIPSSIEEQKQIAQILSSLDDKIELNLHLNQTLEAMAQAIFKEWFINFNVPGFDGELVNGLPRGWKMGSILEIASLLSGGTPKTSVPEYWNGSINWISAKDITNSNNQFIIETEKTITELGIKKSVAKLLPQFTTIVSARGTVGNYCILSEEMAISQSNYGLKSNSDFDYFLFLMVGNMIMMMKAFSYGTVFDTITTKTFQEMEVIIPDNEVIKEFEKAITPFYEKILTNQFQIQTLTQTRDTLLPRLMSGQLKIKN